VPTLTSTLSGTTMLVLLSAIAMVASAQASTPLQLGDRVRVRVSESATPIVGTYISADSDRLTVRTRPGGSDTVRVSFATIVALDASRGRVRKPTRFLRGAILGMLAGATAGLVVGAVVRDSDCADDCGTASAVFSLAGASIGLVTGTALGSSPVDVWVPAGVPGRGADLGAGSRPFSLQWNF
jgi:hypothetical protein